MVLSASIIVYHQWQSVGKTFSFIIFVPISLQKSFTVCRIESRLSDIFSLNLKHNIPTDSRNPSYFDSSGVQSIFLNIPKCCHIPFQSSCLIWFKWILKRQWPKFKVMLTFIVFSGIQILRAATACKGSKCMPMYCGNIGHSIIVKMCP